VAALLAWTGFAEADPTVLGLVVGAVVVAACGYLARRLVRRR
jgi:hypothetical protein